MGLYGLLIPMMAGFGLLIVVAFAWAVRDGQFDDPEGDKHRIFIE